MSIYRSNPETPAPFSRSWTRHLPDSGLLVFVLLLSLIGGSLIYVSHKAGVQSDINKDKSVVLKLWSIPTAGSHVPVDRAKRAIFDSFLHRYPQYGAKSVTGIRLTGSAAESGFLLAMAGNTAPDVYESNFRSITTFIEQNFCFPLEYIPAFAEWKDKVHHWEDRLEDRKIYDKDELERLPENERGRFQPVSNYDHFYLPQVRPIVCRTVLQKNPQTGKTEPVTLTYAFPKSYDIMGMQFNRHLFRQAGLNPEGPSPDWTWEDFYHICQQLTVPEEGKVGFWLPTGNLAGWMFPNFIWQAGGDVVREYYIHPRTGKLVPKLNPATGEADANRFDQELNQAIAAGTVKTCWRAVFDEKPALEALKLYRRLMGQRWTRCREPGCLGLNTVYDLKDEWLQSGAEHICPVCGAKKTYEYMKNRKLVYVGCVIADAGRMGFEMFAQQKCGMRLTAVTDNTGGVKNPTEVGLVAPPRGPKLWRAPDGQVIYEQERDILQYAYNEPESGRLVNVDLSGEPRKIFRYNDLHDGKLHEVDLKRVEFARLRVTALNSDVTHVNNAIWYNVAGGKFPPRPGDAAAIARLTSAERKALDQLNAAWLYLQNETSQNARALRTRIMVDAGMASVLNPEDLKDFGYIEYLKQVSTSWSRVTREMKTYGRPEPYAPGYKVVAIQDMASPVDKTFSACAVTSTQPVEAFRQNVSDEFLASRLRETVTLVNDVRFGTVPPEVVQTRRQIANVALIAVLFVLALFIRKFVRQMRALINAQGGHGTRAFTRRSVVIAWLFMFPTLLSVLVWQYIPLIRGSLMAFQDYFILTTSRFVWLDNFIKLFSDMDFRTALLNTFVYVLLSLSMGFAVPIILAVMLSEVPKGKVFFRVIFYLPNITSGLVITLMWLNFYNGTVTGMLNQILLKLNLISSDQPIRWLQDTESLWGLLPMICVIVPAIWAGAGGGCLIYLAALKGVPDEVYEAADLDGAGSFSKFFRITVPYMKPLILINLVGAFIGSFHAAGNILLMTGGGPDNKTMTIGLQIFYNAYLYLRFGYATAMAWVLGAMLIGFTLYQLRILKDVKFAANS